MSDESPHAPPVFTLGEAAKAAGISKPTLSKAISTGRLSAVKTPDGSYQIQAGELFRVYPPDRKGNRLPDDEVGERGTGKDYRLLEGEVDGLRERLANLSDERERERRQLSDEVAFLRRQLEVEGEERRKIMAILTDQRAKTQEPPAAPAPPQPRSLWARLTGRG